MTITEEEKCARCGLAKSEWKGRWQKPLCKVGETTYESHLDTPTPPTEDRDWRERFDEEFGEYCEGAFYEKEDANLGDEMKSFISQVEATAEARGYKRAQDEQLDPYTTL